MIKKSLFINKGNIVTIDDNGLIDLWNPQTNFNNLPDAFSSIKKFTEPTFIERVELGQLNIDQILSDSSKDNLRNAAFYYNNKMSISDDPAQIEIYGNTTQQLYRKLALLDTGSLKNGDLQKIVSIEETKSKPNYQIIVDISKEIGSFYENQLQNQPGDTAIKKELSRLYWNLSWRQLFVKDFTGSIASAKRGLGLYSINDGINTNLALGYLLNDQYDSAEVIYRKYAGKKLSSDKRLFTTEFLNDFEALKTAGIILTNDERVKKITNILSKK